MEFLSDEYFWYTISFFVFLLILVKFGAKGFLGFLDSRIETIRKEIETAESLRIEAQELLAQYQRKQKDAEKEATLIIDNAKAHAKEIQKNADAELKEMVSRKEAQLKERLKRMEDDAKSEIQAYAAELAIQATGEIVAHNLDKKTGDTLIEGSIENVAARLN